MLLQRRKIGTHFEDLALAWLEEKGLRLVQRNVHFKEGELDLIMEYGPHLVFVEVKGRRGLSMGPVSNALTPKKITRMKKAIWKWRDQTGDRRPGRMLFVGIQGDQFASFWIE